MTTAILETREFTEAQIALRNACAFLKGIICGNADAKGHPYHTTKERTAAFDAGFALGREGRMDAGDITGIHIAHNKLRHRRPHITAEYDAHRGPYPANMLIKKHFGEGIFELATEQAETEKELTNG